MSYRNVKDPNSEWSTPIKVSRMNKSGDVFNTNYDTLDFWNTYMPTVVKSIDEVPVAYSYATTSGDADAMAIRAAMPHKIMQRRFASYRYTGFIVPSALTGRNAY